MSTVDQIEADRPLYGLYVIVVVLIAALTNLSYGEFFVRSAPRH